MTIFQISSAILGLAAPEPKWTGHAAKTLSKLLPVGGAQASFAQAMTLCDAVEKILTDSVERGRVSTLTVTTAESGVNSHGLAELAYERDGRTLLAYFVPGEAVSLLQPGAEAKFNSEYRHAPLTTSTTFNRFFFKEVARSIEISERISTPAGGDGSEYDDEEAKQKRFQKLGVRQGSRYLNIGVDNHVTWPRRETLIEFDRYQMVLMPKTKEHVQSVHVDLTANRLTDIEAMTVINRFLSILTWCDDHFAIAQGGWSGNPVPVPVPKRDLAFITTAYWSLNRSIPESDSARRALALYREARNADENYMVSYAVLNYYKILEIRYPDGPDSRAWIAEKFDSVVDGHREDNSIRSFMEQCGEKPPEKFIWASYRIAVAHSSSRSPSDPDDVTELRRLHTASDILRLFARRLISSELGISDSFDHD